MRAEFRRWKMMKSRKSSSIPTTHHQLESYGLYISSSPVMCTSPLVLVPHQVFVLQALLCYMFPVYPLSCFLFSTFCNFPINPFRTQEINHLWATEKWTTIDFSVGAAARETLLQPTTITYGWSSPTRYIDEPDHPSANLRAVQTAN